MKKKVYRCGEERILEDLKPILNRYIKLEEELKAKKKEEIDNVFIEVKGVKYYSYNQLQDAYGFAVITYRQFDNAAKQLEEIKKFSDYDEVLSQVSIARKIITNIFAEVNREFEEALEDKDEQ